MTTQQTSTGRLQVRVLRRLPALASGLRGRAAGGGRSRRDRLFPGGHPPDRSKGNSTWPWSKARSPRPARRRRSATSAVGVDSSITLGACASDGGIQGLRNFGSLDVKQALAIVYASPQYVETLAHSRPTSDYVPVDMELPGCPINKNQLLGVLGQMLAGSRPKVPNHALCLDCKRQHLVCILVAQGAPCMGPVTSTGCGVLCPSHDRPCYGCFGPSAQPNTDGTGPAVRATGAQARGRSGGSSTRFYANAPAVQGGR